jgi:biopolymer transport protein ExbB
MLMQKVFAVAQGGAQAILVLLLLTSVISVTVMIERWITLRSLRKQSLKAQNRIREALQSASLKDLEEMAKDRESLEGRVLSYAIRHIKENSTDGVEEIFNSFIIMERPNMERSLNFLASVSANAVYVGLLGTVLGIMKAFHDLGVEQNAQAVMAGISEALVATAIGLMVAIPASLSFNYFQKQVKGILQGLEAVKELCIAYAKQTKRGV